MKLLLLKTIRNWLALFKKEKKNTQLRLVPKTNSLIPYNYFFFFFVPVPTI